MKMDLDAREIRCVQLLPLPFGGFTGGPQSDCLSLCYLVRLIPPHIADKSSCNLRENTTLPLGAIRSLLLLLVVLKVMLLLLILMMLKVMMLKDDPRARC